MKAPAGLLRRRKQQIVRFDDRDVSITLGLNGYVFVSPDSPAPQSSASKPPLKQHHDVAAVAAAVRVLVAMEASVDVSAISAILRTAGAAKLEPDRMLSTAALRTFTSSHISIHG